MANETVDNLIALGVPVAQAVDIATQSPATDVLIGLGMAPPLAVAIAAGDGTDTYIALGMAPDTAAMVTIILDA